MSEDPKWQEVGGQMVVPAVVNSQREALLRLKSLIESMIAKEQQNLAIVREQLHRMKHGGGS